MLIPKNVFPISAMCCTDSSRYALGGVCLERDERGPVATATDGKALISVRWDEPATGEFPANAGDDSRKAGFATIIPVKAWSEAAKSIPKKVTKSVLRNVLVEEPSANGTVRLATTDLESIKESKVKPCEGRFPKWRDAIPEHKRSEVATIWVDAALLAETLSTLAKMSTSDGVCRVMLQVPVNGESTIKIVQQEAGMTATAVVMPLSKD